VNAVTVKGLVTIPKPIRRAGNPPRQFAGVRNEQGWPDRPAQAGAENPVSHRFDRFVGIRLPGPTTDEVMAVTRGEGE
jgi:hypothetical protein